MLVGYIHGVAVVLIVGQLGKLTGIDIDAADPVPQLVEMGREIGDVSWATFAVGAAALALLLTARYLTPRLPAALIVAIAAIVASKALSLDEHGVAIVGEIPPGLPDLQLPSPPWDIDSAGLQALEDLEAKLESDGITLHFARAKHPIADRLAERFDGARFHGTVRAAVQAAMSDHAAPAVTS